MKQRYGIIFFISGWIFINLITLTKFLPVGPDEGIISLFGYFLAKSGLPIVIPTMSHVGHFKDIAYHYPGDLFWACTAIMGKLFGFTLFPLRSVSLLCSVISLIFTYLLSWRLFQNRRKAFWASFFLGIHADFILKAHVIRQEPMIVANMLAFLFLFFKGMGEKKNKFLFLSAFLAGLSVLIHPNGILFPAVLFGLAVLYCRRKEIARDTLLKMAGFLALGWFLFIIFDYLPHRTDFFSSLMISFLVEPASRPLHFLTSPLKTIVEFFVNTWGLLWNTRLHNKIIYAGFYLIALGWALIRGGSAHRLVLFILFLVFSISLPFHSGGTYLIYYYPFLAMLLASAIIDIQDESKKYGHPALMKTGVNAGLALMILVSLVPTASYFWRFKKYDWSEEGRILKSYIKDQSKLIVSPAFFFSLPAENIYNTYTLTNCDLQKFMAQQNIAYFVLDDQTKWLYQNFPGVIKQCIPVTTIKRFSDPFGPARDPIKLFDCRALHPPRQNL